MVGDIVNVLRSTGLYDNTIIIFSSDNGGPGHMDDLGNSAKVSRFDPNYLERNYPFRGQKHELYEGGVRVPGFVHFGGMMLPPGAKGRTLHDIVHMTDWLPTIMAAAGVDLESMGHLPLDGVSIWDCLMGAGPCGRDEVVLDINISCDYQTTNPSIKNPKYRTGCPAPKAAMRVGDMKILAECFDTKSLSFKGKMFLYNVTADPGETQDLALAQPQILQKLSSKLLAYGKDAALIPQITLNYPFHGDEYYCKNCTQGAPQAIGLCDPPVWQPWCAGKAGTTCS